MASFALAFLALLAGAGAINVAQQSQEKPVAKVIRLLKEMNTKLEKEADDDQDIYDKMACWCETNEKAKTKAVADGKARDEQLTALIPELAAKSAQLKVEIEQLKKETSANQNALEEATELRAQELGTFRTEEKDGIASISGLRNAVSALSKPHSALTQQVMLQLQQVMKHRSVSASQRKAVSAVMQKKAPHLEEYAPASGEIFGILKGMKESFEGNLANAQKEEADALKSYQLMKASKEHEIRAAITQMENKVSERGAADEKRANSKEDLEDTRNAVTADTEFLMDLQQRCGSMDKQFADRQKTRAEEMAAVSEALKILTDDDAQDLLRKTGLLQVKTATVSSKRDKAMALLRNAGKRLGNPRLSMLAIALKDDVFAKIKVIVDDLVKKLQDEQEDDVKQRDVCIDDLNSNEKETAAKNSAKDDAETRIEELTLMVDNLDEEVAAAKAEIAETQKEMRVASENREKANHEFQQVVTEQRATQQIVQKALDRLAAFYGESASLVQVHSTAGAASARNGQAPPPGFGGDYKKSEGASGVTGMMQKVIDDSKEVESEAVKDEADSQAAYEKFLKDSNAAVDALNKSIADKKANAGKADAEKIRTQEDLKRLNANLDGLKTTFIALHSECDFLLKNFEVRQASRTQEIEALAEAKAVMSGADA